MNEIKIKVPISKESTCETREALIATQQAIGFGSNTLNIQVDEMVIRLENRHIPAFFEALTLARKMLAL